MISGKRLINHVAPTAIKVQAVAHPYRLSVIYMLAHNPLQMHEIAEKIGLPLNLASHHLKMLVKAGWISKSKVGRTVIYSLQPKTLKQILDVLSETPIGSDILKNK
jgi:ArsR family transcriptional regulator, arsenate/arsenite/antimonite-responsive transcriptional repressor